MPSIVKESAGITKPSLLFLLLFDYKILLQYIVYTELFFIYKMLFKGAIYSVGYFFRRYFTICIPVQIIEGREERVGFCFITPLFFVQEVRLFLC